MKLGRYSVEQRIQQKSKNTAFTAIDQNEATDFNEGLFCCILYSSTFPQKFLQHDTHNFVHHHQNYKKPDVK